LANTLPALVRGGVIISGFGLALLPMLKTGLMKAHHRRCRCHRLQISFLLIWLGMCLPCSFFKTPPGYFNCI